MFVFAPGENTWARERNRSSVTVLSEMVFLDYFQLAAVALVLLIIAGKTLHSYIATGINPIVIGRGRGWWRLIEALSGLAVVLWIVEVVLRGLHSRFEIFPQALPLPFLHTEVAKGLGVLLVIFGLVLFLLAYLNFGASWRVGIDRRTPGELVTRGIFALSRNPIYAGSTCCFIGIFLIDGTWFFFIYDLLAILGIHFEILREEEFLKKQYGRDYDEYSRRTPRYLIW